MTTPAFGYIGEVSAEELARNRERFERAADDQEIEIELNGVGDPSVALQLWSPAELLQLKAPQFLIDGVLPAGGLACLYGSPGAGKSFLALDLASCIAAGEPWQERPTTGGTVVYILAEGVQAFRKRIRARLREDPSGSRLTFIPTAVLLDADDQVEKLRELLAPLDGLVLLVVDTLARCMTGDESSSRDMGAVIRAVDDVRREHQAACLLLHHCGKNTDRGMRGSSALLGAADTILRLTASGGGAPKNLKLAIEKQKDDDAIDPIPLSLEQVELADRSTSCRIAPRMTAGRSHDPDARARLICEILREEGEMKSSDVVCALMERASLGETRAKEALASALKRGLVVSRKHGRCHLYRLADATGAGEDVVAGEGAS